MLRTLTVHRTFLFNTPDVGSNPNTHILAFCILCVAAHRKLWQRNEDRQCSPLLAPSCARGDCALAHIIAAWCGLAQTFRPRRACEDGPPAVTRACCLRAASQWRLAIVCIPNKVVSKVLRSSAFGLCRCGRQAVLTAVICFGLCASEEWAFAYIPRPGCKLISA